MYCMILLLQLQRTLVLSNCSFNKSYNLETFSGLGTVGGDNLALQREKARCDISMTCTEGEIFGI